MPSRKIQKSTKTAPLSLLKGATKFADRSKIKTVHDIVQLVKTNPHFFLRKRIYFVFEILLQKKINSDKSSIFCAPTKSRK